MSFDKSNDETLNDTSAESSTATQTPDAKPTDPGSSPGSDANTSESSSDGGAKEPATLADAIARAMDKADEPPAEASPTPENAEQPESAETVSDAPGEKDDAPAEPGDKPKDTKPDDVPFHKHPRWQELVKREKELAGEVTRLRTRAQAVDELAQLTGGEEGFANMQALARAFANDPAQAVPMLETLLQDAKARGGTVVTSDDLKKKVEQGELDEASALEIEQARRLKASATERQQAQAQQQAKAVQDAMIGALNSWEKNISERDPDYSVLSADVQDRLKVLALENMPRNADEAVKLAVQAYDEVKKRNAARLPKRPPVRTALSDGSSRTAKPKPRSLREVVEATLGG